MTDVKLKIASVGCFIEGEDKINTMISNRQDATEAVDAKESPILSIRNKETYLTKDNASVAYPTYLSANNDSNKSNIIRLTTNATLTAPVYVDVDATTSMMEYDVSATGITGGETTVFKAIVSASSSIILNLKELGIELEPTQVLTITQTATSAGTGDVIVVINFIEDQ